MTTKTLSTVLTDYKTILKLQQQLQADYEAKLSTLTSKRDKMEAWLLNQDETTGKVIEDDLKAMSPYVFWHITEKTNASSIEAYRQLRDDVQEQNRVAKDNAEVQNGYKDTIGAWILAKLNTEGENSVNCGESGKAYKKLVTHASAADFDALIKWAGENNAADIVQKRVNSAFVNKYAEENGGELPPFVNVMRSFEVVVTK